MRINLSLRSNRSVRVRQNLWRGCVIARLKLCSWTRRSENLTWKRLKKMNMTVFNLKLKTLISNGALLNNLLKINLNLLRAFIGSIIKRFKITTDLRMTLTKRSFLRKFKDWTFSFRLIPETQRSLLRKLSLKETKTWYSWIERNVHLLKKLKETMISRFY